MNIDRVLEVVERELARLSHTLATHLANHLAASGFVLLHQITLDMPWSSSSPGDQSITHSEPSECEISGLALFEKTERAERPEKASVDRATIEKDTDLWSHLRADMEKVADFMNGRGYRVTVGNSDDRGTAFRSGPMVQFLDIKGDVIAGLDFHCSLGDNTLLSRYYGRAGKDLGKLESISLASIDYESDVVPILANFIPFALGMGEIVCRSDAPPR